MAFYNIYYIKLKRLIIF